MSILAPTMIEATCPACDYERSSKGRPLRNGSQLECLDCGTTWREFDDKAQKPSTSAKITKPVPERKLFGEYSKAAIKGLNQTKEEKQSGYSMRSGNRSALYLTGIAGVIFLFCLASSVSIIQSMSHKKPDHTITGSISKSDLKVAEVQLEERLRPTGKKVFTVRGLLSNPTQNTKPLPRLAIILRNEHGAELTRWYYKAPIALLEQGRKLRFSSSIQYDTPMATYAEAKFE